MRALLMNSVAAGVLSSASVAGLRRALQPIPGLTLLVVFGSRARGEASADSDWDLGFLGEAELDHGLLMEVVTRAVGTDRVDLVDLSRATALLRFRAARDGVPVFEHAPGRFIDYQEDATLAWCDLEPVLRRAYGGVLEDLVAK